MTRGFCSTETEDLGRVCERAAPRGNLQVAVVFVLGRGRHAEVERGEAVAARQGRSLHDGGLVIRVELQLARDRHALHWATCHGVERTHARA